MNKTTKTMIGPGMWHAVGRNHHCYPPRTYPQGYGTGSQWTCGCGNVWQADGYRLAAEGYPVGARPEAGVLLGPKRWIPTSRCSTTEAEAALYDWRDPSECLIEYLRGTR